MMMVVRGYESPRARYCVGAGSLKPQELVGQITLLGHGNRNLVAVEFRCTPSRRRDPTLWPFLQGFL